MRADVAAAYVGLSLSTFYREVDAHRLPQPAAITDGRQIWLKDDLDLFLEALFQRGKLSHRVDTPVKTANLKEELEQW